MEVFAYLQLASSYETASPQERLLSQPEVGDVLSRDGLMYQVIDRSASGKSAKRVLSFVVTAAIASTTGTVWARQPGENSDVSTAQRRSSTFSILVSQSAPSPASELLLSQAAGDSTFLQLNDSGDLVTELQERLTELGYYDGPISGFFGPLTQAAVIRFQEANGLVADGIVGLSTAEALRTGGVQTPAPSPSVSPPASAADGLLQLDDSGDAVTALQTRLRDLGYYDGPITGFFGPLTEDAVIRFQQDRGLTADGIVGPSTQEELNETSTQPPQGATPSPSPAPTADDGILQRGESGPAVADLQRRLIQLGLYEGVADGNFDFQTEAAVVRFQQLEELTPDGIVGPTTVARLQNPQNVAQQPTPTPSPSPITQPPIVTPSPSPVTQVPQDLSGGRFSVTELQQRLQRRGFYSGPIDGRLTAQTREAIAAAQQAYWLNESDIVNGRF